MKFITTLIAASLAVALSACQAETNTSSTQEKAAMTAEITTLQKIDTQAGDGREAEAGLNISVHYTGWLYDPEAEVRILDFTATRWGIVAPRNYPYQLDRDEDKRFIFVFNMGIVTLGDS